MRSAKLHTMKRSAAVDDLFGHVPQKGEMDLPVPVSRGPIVNTPERSRDRLTRLIARLRSCDTWPFTPYQTRNVRGSAPWIAEWLKDGEGDRLLAELRAELVRFGVDPNRPEPGEPVPERLPGEGFIDVFA